MADDTPPTPRRDAQRSWLCTPHPTLAPTLVGTVYDMNFRVMPELAWTYGCPTALVLMASVSLVLYAVFKRRNWI